MSALSLRAVRKFFSFLFLLLFITQSFIPVSFASNLPSLITPAVIPQTVSAPVQIRGLIVNAENPFRFEFLIGRGKTQEGLKEESARLVKYFLASLTVPEKEMWVNLNPQEEDRIIPDRLGRTEMGRDLLAQDYILKRITASLLSPENESGEKFWSRVYAKSWKQFGTRDIDANILSRVWIVPDKAVVFEKNSAAYIVESRLKVMLENDYLSQEAGIKPDFDLSPAAAEIMRSIIIPEIEKEINRGASFAPLRQIYQSMILAAWFKVNLKKHILNQVYTDQNKITGVESKGETPKDIYREYLKLFQDGVARQIQEEYDPVTQQITARKYVTGGYDNAMLSEKVLEAVKDFALLSGEQKQDIQSAGDLHKVTVDVLAMTPQSEAQGDEQKRRNKVRRTLQALNFFGKVMDVLDQGPDDNIPAEAAGQDTGESWSDVNAPSLKHYTVASLQFEAGLDRGIVEKLIARYGESISRFTTQLTLTGGLGALMHDLIPAWIKNGVDVAPINPLYSIGIKGNVSQRIGETLRLGDMLRSVLDKTDMTFRIVLDDPVFRQHADNYRARDVMGREVFIDIFKGESKFVGRPLYYQDAYYYNDAGHKEYIFDEVYPDNDFRDVQMAVYNQASQLLLKELQKRNIVKDRILFVDNEVFVSLPKRMFPSDRNLKDHINHTVWKPGMYKPKWYSFNLLGFTEKERAFERFGEIYIGEYAAASSNFVSGVGLYEHTPVLREKVFPNYQDQIWGYDQDGMRNTNTVLFDQWEGKEIRALISKYKKILGFSEMESDPVFYAELEKNMELKKQFLSRFEYIKAFYGLDLLLFLNRTQPQEMGGGAWAKELLNEAGYSVKGMDDFKKIKEEFFFDIQRILKDELQMSTIRQRYGSLKETLLRNPVFTNVRRQVAYKGPDKYLEIFHKMKQDPELVKRFRESNTRGIIGGRAFGADAVGLFNELKRLAKELGLEDRFAFIENYNLSDAPIIFKGVSASVMISDEFLEASATSQEKTISDGADLIGVWGGANPELFDIVDTESGEHIDVLKISITHDHLREGLKNGKYSISNGYLVFYNDKEYSAQEMGGRRPSAESLLETFISLGQDRQDETFRKEKWFHNLKNSWRVDMERSQARAHIKMWERAIALHQAMQKIKPVLQMPEVRQALENGIAKKPFIWKKGQTDVIGDGGTTLRSLLKSYNILRFRGDDWIIQSIEYHLSNGNPQGDVLKRIEDLMDKPELEPLKEVAESFGDFVPQKADKAVITDTPDSVQNQVGGIDLGSVNLNLRIQRDSQGAPLDWNLQNVRNMNIQGFKPVIVSIVPVENLLAP